MSELALRRDETALTPSGMTPAELAVVKDTICKGASNEELSFFLATCARTGLNPLQRQIHAVKRWNNDERRETLTIQVGIDGFRLIADRTGRYVPGREPTYTYDLNGNLESATAYVKKLVAGEWHEIAATAYYVEYCQRKKDGEPNRMWATMPRVMLAKCSEALALRKAFPAETAGVYSPEEMAQADNPEPAPRRPTVRETGRPALPPATIDASTGEVTNAPPSASPKRGKAEQNLATLILEAHELNLMEELPGLARFKQYPFSTVSNEQLAEDLAFLRSVIKSAREAAPAPEVVEEEVADPFADA